MTKRSTEHSALAKASCFVGGGMLLVQFGVMAAVLVRPKASVLPLPSALAILCLCPALVSWIPPKNSRQPAGPFCHASVC